MIGTDCDDDYDADMMITTVTRLMTLKMTLTETTAMTLATTGDYADDDTAASRGNGAWDCGAVHRRATIAMLAIMTHWTMAIS